MFYLNPNQVILLAIFYGWLQDFGKDRIYIYIYTFFIDYIFYEKYIFDQYNIIIENVVPYT